MVNPTKAARHLIASHEGRFSTFLTGTKESNKFVDLEKFEIVTCECSLSSSPKRVGCLQSLSLLFFFCCKSEAYCFGGTGPGVTCMHIYKIEEQKMRDGKRQKFLEN